MHPINRPGLAALREEFLAAHGTCNNVAHEWVALGEVGGKVHLFPGRVSAVKLTTCTSF